MACIVTKVGHAEPCLEHKSNAAYASSDYVNLRAAPSSSSTILRALNLGTRLTVREKNSVCARMGERTGRWVNVSVLDDDPVREGWVFDANVTYQDEAPISSPELFTAFDIYKEMLPKSFGQVWVGLAKTSQGYELKQYSLKVKKNGKPGIDDSPMYKILTVPADQVVFLVRGVKNLKPGRVVAARPVARPIQMWEKKRFTVSLGSETYRFSTGCMERRREQDELRNAANKYYSCELAIKGPADAVFSINDHAGEPVSDIPWMPYQSVSDLVWAGDLDGDGRLDFLIRETTNSESIDSLFLSSLATGKEVARRAALNRLVWD